MTREGNTETIWEGDTEDWVFTIEHPETGAARDLSGATVTISMRSLRTGTMVIEDAACTHDDTGGTITYDVQTADVDDPGEYERMWTVTLAAGAGVKHYPDPDIQARDYLRIKSRVESTDTTA